MIKKKDKMFNDKLLELYNDGKLYDAENTNQQDISFWRSIVKTQQVSTFLELGCGTGRIGTEVLPFLQTYHGVDLSKTFLERFQEKTSSSKKGFKLFQGTMQSFSTDKIYDVVAIPFNSFSHLFTSEDISSTLLNVKKHMDSKSRFIFDIHNPSLELLTRDPDKEFVAKTFTVPWSQHKITVYESNKYNNSTQINHIVWRYVNQDNSEIKKLELPMRMFYPKEMNNYLRFYGFEIIAKYGSFDREAFSSESSKQIFICQKER